MFLYLLQLGEQGKLRSCYKNDTHYFYTSYFINGIGISNQIVEVRIIKIEISCKNHG
jgi:hypothetical protein